MCVSVSSSSACPQKQNRSTLTAPSGYMLLRPPEGSPNHPVQVPCPWLIQADPGRHINISRIRLSGEYGLHRMNDGGITSSNHVCPYVLKITDGRYVETYEPCEYSSSLGSDVIYTSKGSSVEVKVIWRDRKMRSGAPSLYQYTGEYWWSRPPMGSFELILE